jgi:hypothetical protein
MFNLPDNESTAAGGLPLTDFFSSAASFSFYSSGFPCPVI